MDFLDPKKKRAHKIRLYIGYALMAIALGIGTLILVFEANGYDLDPKTGSVVQNGLVFIDAHPVTATAYVDGQEKGQTDTRLILPAGNHSIELKRDGYRSWYKHIDLEGSIIRRFAYPFLFPQNLVTKDIQAYAGEPGFASESPDRHWLIVQHPGSLTNFDVVDLNQKTNPITSLVLPADLMAAAGSKHTLEMVEWSTDNRHVLIKHTFDTGYEFAVIDREVPSSSLNINKLFQVPITSLTLRDKKFDQYYLYEANGGIIRRADAKTKQAVPFLTNVITFKPHGTDVILFVSNENSQATGKVNVKIWDNEKIYTLRQLPNSKTYLVDLARFDGKWYMAAGDDSEGKTYIYRDPFNELKQSIPKIPLPISVLKVQSPQYISFSAIARFIAIQGGSEFAVYDAENNDQFRYDTKLQLLPNQKAEWMDGHRLMTVSDQKLVVFDFDGTNTQILNAANPAYSIFFDRDYEGLFTMSASKTDATHPALTRTELRILPQ